MQIVNSDLGLTTFGYVLFGIIAVALILGAVFLYSKSNHKKLSTRQLVFCAVAMALAFVTSYIK
ncbi:MAG: proton-coupled thiamine transporter YuaJ, partial [Lachnospiraceae bacterium]|nr:proton-coupled thiamine transporter YuaJ [Lachnospiraceae bacterium]